MAVAMGVSTEVVMDDTAVVVEVDMAKMNSETSFHPTTIWKMSLWTLQTMMTTSSEWHLLIKATNRALGSAASPNKVKVFLILSSSSLFCKEMYIIPYFIIMISMMPVK